MKKLFALLMALVLVISAVPLMASATEEAPCEHYKNEPTGRYLGGNQHEMKCLLCEDYYFAADCIFENGKCIACGNAEPDAVCQHYNAESTGKYLGNNKHEMKCKDCKKEFPTDCYFVDGECIACGNAEVCKHYNADPTGKYLDNDKHEMKCKDCGGLFSADCYFVDGVCIGCGHPCNHEGEQQLITNGDGKTHNAYCTKCGELMAKEIKCGKQADGKCACGRVMTGKPVVDPTLDNVPKTGDVLAPVALLSGLMSTVGLAVKKFFF